jgi:hypothetical protein
VEQEDIARRQTLDQALRDYLRLAANGIEATAGP